MSVSRKDYEWIAKAVGAAIGEVMADWSENHSVDAALSDLRDVLVGRMSFYFMGDNPRFQLETFANAVEVAADNAYDATLVAREAQSQEG